MKLAAACIALLLQAAIASGPPQGKPASIDGMVTRRGNSEAIAGAQLELSRVVVPETGMVPPKRTATTDTSGKFTIKDLEAGAYKLMITSNGYVRQEYGQRTARAQGVPIVLAAGQAMKDLAVQLTPAGSVSGHVRNHLGRPLVGIPVQLVRWTYDATGKQSFQSVGPAARTDDRGEFRLYWIMPGRYYLVAGQGRMEDFRETSDLSRRNEVVDKYPFTFFPGVTEFEKAHTIDVPAGGELGPSDFTLARPQQYRIRARVIDPATGKAPSRVIVVIGYWTTNGQGSMASPGYYNAQTGMIELNNLVPGAYSVGATLYDGGTVPNSVFSRGAPGPSAAARFFIVDSDIDAPPLTLAAPSVITGRIRLDGQPSDSTPLNSVQISFLPPTEEIAISPEAGLRPIMAFPRKDGTFTANIPHSAIRVMVSELPAGFYVKEVKLDGADALSDAAPVSRPGELEIVLSSKAGRIDGVVKDERLQPAAGVQTVLIPVERRNHPELYKEVTTDLSGRFSISGVPPGGYKLFAWEDLEPYTYFDPEVLEKFEQKGQPVHVSESSHLTLDVRVIPGGNE